MQNTISYYTQYTDGSLRQHSLFHSTLAAVTNSRIIINEVRVFQTDEGGTVDITRLESINKFDNIHVVSLTKFQSTIINLTYCIQDSSYT